MPSTKLAKLNQVHRKACPHGPNWEIWSGQALDRDKARTPCLGCLGMVFNIIIVCYKQLAII